MAIFSKVEEFFENYSPSDKWGEDLTPYFEEKGELVWGYLSLFTKYNDRLDEAAKPLRNKAIKPLRKTEAPEAPVEQCDNVSGVDEEIFLAIYEEMLGDNYTPPSDNSTGIQWHLHALWVLYSFARPQSIAFTALLKLDIAALKIASTAAMFIGGSPSYIERFTNRVSHIRSNPGRPKKQLSEAVEFVYEMYLKKGNIEPLKPYKIKLFFEILKSELKREAKDHLNNDYLQERIKSVNTGTWLIKTQGDEERRINPDTCDRHDVSKILHHLRGEKPLPE